MFKQTAISAISLLAVSTSTLSFQATPAAAGPFTPPGMEMCLTPGNCPKPQGPMVVHPIDPCILQNNCGTPPPPPPNNGGNFGQGLATGVGMGVGMGIVGALTRPRQPQVIVQQPQQPVVMPAQTATSGNLQLHIAECHRKYKTYDVNTNSFMSNAGYRKPCKTPFM